MILTKFTDYYINGSDFFINEIQKEINLRDIRGLTNGRVEAIRVSGEHPLILLIGNIIDPTQQVNFAGIVPAIAVVENDEVEEATTIGQGKRAYGTIDEQWIADMQAKVIKERNKDGIITDGQLQLIQNAVAGGKKLYVAVEEFYLRESVFISLWTHTLEEQRLIGYVLRSILFDLRKKMIARGLHDISIRTSKGLVNYNFGKILRGQETEISYLNGMRNYTVTDEEVNDDNFDIIVHGLYKNTVDNTTVQVYEE